MRNQQIYEEASEWFVRMRDGDDVPVSAASSWNGCAARPSTWAPISISLRCGWNASMWMWIPASISPRASPWREPTRAWRSWCRASGQAGNRLLGGHGWFALVASTLLLIAAVATAWWQFGRSTHSTGLGEQRSIALRDGSTIELNSDSRVRIRLDEHQRTIELLRGQALFHVAKDASRPFIVHADTAAVRAVGTVFDVYRKDTGAIVTVVEGRVSVMPHTETLGAAVQRTQAAEHASIPDDSLPGSQEQQELADRSGGEVFLDAGEQITMNAVESAGPKPVNISAATAWTRRELVFEFTPLAEVAAEFNRYNERQLIVEDEALRAFKISAVFRSTDTGALLRYLENMPGVRIEEGAAAVRITSKSK